MKKYLNTSTTELQNSNELRKLVSSGTLAQSAFCKQCQSSAFMSICLGKVEYNPLKPVAKT